MKKLIDNIAGWVRIDGLLHIETVFMVTILVYTFMRIVGSQDSAVFVSFALGLIVSMGKEIWDENHSGHTAEGHDLICDFIGILLALFTMIVLHG